MSYGTYKPVKSIRQLKIGDIIKHASTDGKTYIVTNNYGDRVTAVASADVTNPGEWLVFELNTNPIIR